MSGFYDLKPLELPLVVQDRRTATDIQYGRQTAVAMPWQRYYAYNTFPSGIIYTINNSSTGSVIYNLGQKVNIPYRDADCFYTITSLHESNIDELGTDFYNRITMRPFGFRKAWELQYPNVTNILTVSFQKL